MAFRLTNVSATNQAMMNTIFSDLLDNVEVIYLDDILISVRNQKDNTAMVMKILNRLRAGSSIGTLKELYGSRRK